MKLGSAAASKLLQLIGVLAAAGKSKVKLIVVCAVCVVGW